MLLNMTHNLSAQRISSTPKPASSPSLILTNGQLSSVVENERESSLSTGLREVPVDSKADQENSLKDAVVEALTSLIPHKRSLKIKMLLNYSVDNSDSGDEDNTGSSSSFSRCIVVDKTVVRRELRTDFDGSQPSASKRPRLDTAMDLSLNNHVEEPSTKRTPENGLTNSQQQQIAELIGCIKRLNDSLPSVGSLGNSTTPAVKSEQPLSNSVGDFDNDLTSNLLNFIKSQQPSMDTDASTTGLLAAAAFSAQNQQQQQLCQQLQFMNAFKLPGVDANNHATSPPSETDPGSLLNRLTSMMNANQGLSAANSSTIGPNANPPLFGAPIGSGNPLAALLPSAIGGAGGLSSLVANQVCHPLLGAFTPDQLAALNAVQLGAGGNTTSGLQRIISMPMSSAPVTTSFNLQPTKLISVKDRQTGLDTFGIIPLVSTAASSSPGHSLVGGTQTIHPQPLALGGSSTMLFNPGSHPMTLTTTSSPSNGSATNVASQLRFTPLNMSAASGCQAPGNNTLLARRLMQQVNNNGFATSSAINNNANNNRRFMCNQCRNTFLSLAELNRHTLDEHNSFKCTICSAHFTQRSNLQRHSLKHVGFKPFTCNICRKEYYRKDHLVRHIEVTHPNHDPKANITVHLTSSECLDYLDRMNIITGDQDVVDDPTGSPGLYPLSGEMSPDDIKVDPKVIEDDGCPADELIDDTTDVDVIPEYPVDSVAFISTPTIDQSPTVDLRLAENSTEAPFADQVESLAEDECPSTLDQ